MNDKPFSHLLEKNLRIYVKLLSGGQFFDAIPTPQNSDILCSFSVDEGKTLTSVPWHNVERMTLSYVPEKTD